MLDFAQGFSHLKEKEITLHKYANLRKQIDKLILFVKRRLLLKLKPRELIDYIGQTYQRPLLMFTATQRCSTREALSFSAMIYLFLQCAYLCLNNELITSTEDFPK